MVVAKQQPHAVKTSPESSWKTLEPQRDRATARGTHKIIQFTVRDYLSELGLWDGKRLRVPGDTTAAPFQRGRLDITRNPIKQRMLRDLLRGGTLPPLVLYESRDEGGRWRIVDGLQRTDVLTQALKAILAVENDEEILPYAQDQLDAMKKTDQPILTSEEFLGRPLTVQVWKDLDHDELIRLFIVLNVGQQKVPPRHLLEVIKADLKGMFEDWGLVVETLKEKMEKPRGRRSKEDAAEPPAFHFEYLIDGLVAYVTKNPQIKTLKLLEGDDMPEDLTERVTDIGSELCKADFTWVCVALNSLMQDRYRGNPRGEAFIQKSDNYFIPIMAALGWARQTARVADQVEQRQQQLMEALESSTGPDPLVLDDSERGLVHICDTVKSNIGRKRRAIIFAAWRNLFRTGVTDPEYPLDWEFANLSE